MLPASRLPAHFTALFYFVSILLCLFLDVREGLPQPMRIAHFCALLYLGLQWTHFQFPQESNKYAKCSLTFPLKNGPITFYVNFTNTNVIVDKREGVVSRGVQYVLVDA